MKIELVSDDGWNFRQGNLYGGTVVGASWDHIGKRCANLKVGEFVEGVRIDENGVQIYIGKKEGF